MKKWLSTFWWARGVLAAISIAAFLPDIVDLSRFEILRAFHVVLWAWNDLMTDFGEYLGTIFPIPAIPPGWINLLIYFSSFVIPILFGISRFEYPSGKLANLFRPFYYLCAVSILCAPLLIFSSPGYFLNNLFRSILVIFFFSIVSLQALSQLPGFKGGLVTFIGFILCIEVLYWFQTPLVTEAINSFSCSHVELPSPGCPDDRSN